MISKILNKKIKNEILERKKFKVKTDWKSTNRKLQKWKIL